MNLWDKLKNQIALRDGISLLVLSTYFGGVAGDVLRLAKMVDISWWTDMLEDWPWYVVVASVISQFTIAFLSSRTRIPGGRRIEPGLQF